MTSISSVSVTNGWAGMHAAKAKSGGGKTDLLSELNSDSSDSVDETQFDAMLQDSPAASGLSDTDASNLFNALDTNGDGVVSAQELAAGMQALAEPPPPPPSTMDFAAGKDAGSTSATSSTSDTSNSSSSSSDASSSTSDTSTSTLEQILAQLADAMRDQYAQFSRQDASASHAATGTLLSVSA